MRDFAAIDFETANGFRSSVCSVGIVIVKDGRIVDKFYSLIRPRPNYYSYFTTAIHGLDHIDTDYEASFPEVWARVSDKLKGLPLVSHNRPFDEGCLKAAFKAYDMEYPGYEFHCTLKASRKCMKLKNHKLGTVAGACGYDLTHHHHALSDDEAASVICKYICEKFGDNIMFN